MQELVKYEVCWRPAVSPGRRLPWKYFQTETNYLHWAVSPILYGVLCLRQTAPDSRNPVENQRLLSDYSVTDRGYLLQG